MRQPRGSPFALGLAAVLPAANSPGWHAPGYQINKIPYIYLPLWLRPEIYAGLNLQYVAAVAVATTTTTTTTTMTTAAAAAEAARVFYETSHPFVSRTTRSTRKSYVFLLETGFSKSIRRPTCASKISYTRAFFKCQADQIPKIVNSALWRIKITDVISMYATSENISMK